MTKRIENNFELDKYLAAIAQENIQIPASLASQTAEIISTESNKERNLFPYILGMVFAVNLAISFLFGGVLFLLRPLSVLDWIIVGSVYSTANVLLYGITFINYENLRVLLNAYSMGGN